MVAMAYTSSNAMVNASQARTGPSLNWTSGSESSRRKRWAAEALAQEVPAPAVAEAPVWDLVPVQARAQAGVQLRTHKVQQSKAARIRTRQASAGKADTAEMVGTAAPEDTVEMVGTEDTPPPTVCPWRRHIHCPSMPRTPRAARVCV